MKKIPMLYLRDFTRRERPMTSERNPACAWVGEEGKATRKYDGTAMRIQGGVAWKRYDAKQGKTPPAGFEPAQLEPDPETGHWPGWLPIERESPDDRWHYLAFAGSPGLPDGTYELCGPKINGNTEGLKTHELIPHGADVLDDPPVAYDALVEWLRPRDIEGIVWHHPDGRMAKIKKSDFGLQRREPS